MTKVIAELGDPATWDEDDREYEASVNQRPVKVETEKRTKRVDGERRRVRIEIRETGETETPPNQRVRTPKE